MYINDCNFRECEFSEYKIIDRYNKVNVDETTKLYKELFKDIDLEKEVKTSDINE
jgi:hypothetical protein